MLSHVLWIGGATDCGKSTIAARLAEKYDAQVYHYDHHDLRHHEILAETSDKYLHLLHAPLDERWVHPTPQFLLERSMASFYNRFPLVLQDFEAMSEVELIVAEGFGFTPELIVPHLPDIDHAIWLVPTRSFKIASMKRRNKPSQRHKTSDPQKHYENLLNRDLLIAEYYRKEVPKIGGRLVEVDGSLDVDGMVDLVERHFNKLLPATL